MSKYNIFVLTINTTPLTKLSREEADATVDYISEAIHVKFNEKFGEGTWGGQSVLSITDGGLSHLYLVFPEKDTIDEMKRLIELEVLLIVGKRLNVTFSNVDHICDADNIDDAVVKTNGIVDKLFNDVIGLH